ncbi:hypothetical protein TRFO_28843 [Tritrichomonas foetus]|uniref:RING-type domain-containing protein n=1 Tax=Tritrichomonas foetus TaxID=1144522 RepID=A0A1J4K1P2_9EUKA|nr:hypothetical protein TRFO_28843 [Tritrichomonas foetus]|eukprot:OHT03662.1 hypothetical protein TRFO_28843 [Tritrichomonas foetus]
MSSISNPPRKGFYRRRRVPKAAYFFHSYIANFKHQRSRVTSQMRPISSSAFVAGNFMFVYKSTSQLQSIPEPIQNPLNTDNPENNPKTMLADDSLNELNDVLYSHSMHPNSGAEFPLLFSVISHQPEDYVCPICLFKPVAPRITHCGHIFCADCITEHMSMCEEPLCPICYKKLMGHPLIRTDLRLYPSITSSGSHFLFQKVIRNHNNCVCFRSDDQNTINLPTASSPSAPFCHFLLADNQYISKLVETEKKDLLDQLRIFHEEYNDELKSSFIQEILDQVSSETIPDLHGLSFVLEEFKENDLFRFYQDSCGRLIYLDPLTIKMLVMQFGSIANAPDTLEVDSLKISTFSVDQHFRDRHRSLGHLPAGADVSLVLADLSKIVSEEVLSAFAKQIEKRVKIEEDEELPEEETEILTEADFPSIFQNTSSNATTTTTMNSQGGNSNPAQRQHSQPASSSAWAKIKVEEPKMTKKPSLDEDFPSFGSAFTKKKTAWGTPQSQPPPQQQPQQRSDFPSFGDMNRNKK